MRRLKRFKREAWQRLKLLKWWTSSLSGAAGPQLAFWPTLRWLTTFSKLSECSKTLARPPSAYPLFLTNYKVVMPLLRQPHRTNCNICNCSLLRISLPPLLAYCSTTRAQIEAKSSINWTKSSAWSRALKRCCRSTWSWTEYMSLGATRLAKFLKNSTGSNNFVWGMEGRIPAKEDLKSRSRLASSL